MVGAPTASSSLKEYLKRYQDENEVQNKKKKKKKKAVKSTTTGVLVVDEDPVWQKPVKLEDEEDNDSADEEKPQINEDIEVKRMKRLELIRSRRPFGMISEDGSGWVSVAETSKGTDQMSDGSPVRKRRSDTPSPERDLMSNLDLSPPRKRGVRNDMPSPEHHLKHAHKPDLSPPRKRGARNDTPSPGYDSRRAREADVSPPRKRGARKDKSFQEPDLSPPRKHVRKAEVELSRSRKHTARHDSPSPERESRASRAAEEDLSPPRQRQKHNQSSRKPSSNFVVSDADISPPRRVRQDDSRASFMLDLSPPRKGRNTKSMFSDLPDKPAGSSGLDLSPPRKKNKETLALSQRVKTGLVTGTDIKEEIVKSKKEEFQRFKEMDPSISGRGAEAVYRDKKTGEQISKEQYLNSKKKEKPKEIKLEWGKGLAQKREAEAKLQELESEKEKPFARTRDDPELDKMLKERPRFGDPMAHLVKKKQRESVLENLGDNEKMKESGFIIPQDIPSHSWIKRNIHPPENRYGIRPGRHWDGVDRSTGFEKQMFQMSNEKQATEKEAYLWSVADM